MRFFLFIQINFLVLLSMIPFLSGAQWTWESPTYQGNTLTTGFFKNPNSAEIFGCNGAKLRTFDGGVSWIQENLGVKTNIISVSFPSAQIGYAVGYNYSDHNTIFSDVLKTIDGGQSWTNVLHKETFHGFNKVQFINETTGFVSGHKNTTGFILKTTDGGTSWDSLPFPIIPYEGTFSAYDFQFLNSAIGIASGTCTDHGHILKTIDGGITWTSKMGDFENSFTGLIMLNSFTGFAGSDNSSIYKTTNGGNSWQKVYEIVDFPSKEVHSFFFTDSVTGYAILKSGYINTSGKSVILKTTDTGNTWDSIFSINRNVDGIFFKDSLNGFLIGEYGTILETHNAGLTWDSTRISQNTLILDGQYVNNNIGYAIGVGAWGSGDSCSYVLKTINSGLNWNIIYTVPNVTFYSVHFTDSLTGFIVSLHDGVYKTSNGGHTWTQIINNPGNELYSVSFYNEQTGFVLGSPGISLRTDDGGNTWSQSNLFSSSVLHNISFADSSTWYISLLGSDTIYKTSDKGATWEIKTTGSFLLQESDGLCFTDKNNGYLLSNDKILKTNDGAETWSVYSNGFQEIYTALNFLDADTGFVFKYNGYAYKTTDQGITWNPIDFPSQNAVLSLIFTPQNKLVAMGEGGMILSSMLLSPVNPIDTTSTPISVFPNPVSENASISFLNTGNKQMKLIIRNSSGSIVKKISDFNGNTLSFSTKNLPNGLYFFEVRSTDGTLFFPGKFIKL